jgi:hypothetical protein
MAMGVLLVALPAAAESPPATAEPTAPTSVTRSTAAAEPRAPRVQLTSLSAGLPQQGQWRNGLSIADLNGDGHLDLVHGPPRKGPNRPVVFLGDGAGHWAPWSTARFPDMPYAYGAVAVADFDADGHPDIALAMHERGVAVLLGDGQGHFRAAHGALAGDTQDGVIFGSRALAVADLNGDQRPDVIALGEGMSRPVPGRGGLEAASTGLALFLNRPDGVWQRQLAGAAHMPFGDALATGDVNGDQRVDVLIASHRVGDRDLLYIGEAAGGLRATAVKTLPDGAYVNAVCLGNVDHAGGDDLVLGYTRYAEGAWRTALDLFTGDGTGQWRRHALVDEPGSRSVTALACGDVDADGELDIVALTGDGDLWILLGNGTGAFRRAAVTGRVPNGCRGYSIALADMTGDRRAEIFAGFAGEGSAFETDTCPGGGRLEVWQPNVQ